MTKTFREELEHLLTKHYGDVDEDAMTDLIAWCVRYGVFCLKEYPKDTPGPSRRNPRDAEETIPPARMSPEVAVGPGV